MLAVCYDIGHVGSERVQEALNLLRMISMQNVRFLSTWNFLSNLARIVTLSFCDDKIDAIHCVLGFE